MTVEIGKRYRFNNGYKSDDDHNGELVTVTRIDDSKIAQTAYGDVAIWCVTDAGVEGVAFEDELEEVK